MRYARGHTEDSDVYGRKDCGDTENPEAVDLKLKSRQLRVLAVASGGGHWLELCRLLPAFNGLDVAFVSVHRNYAGQVPSHRFYTIRDMSRLDPWGGFMLLPQLLRIILRERPSVVITTGSAPALLTLALAKLLFRSRTIWIDSIANVNKLSTSGTLARHVADIRLTQWPALQSPHGPAYWGEVF